MGIAGRNGMREIDRALDDVGRRFGGAARETILLENLDKHRFEIARLLEALPGDGTALDLGGGLGVNLLVLRRLRPDARLLLVDRFREYTADNRMGPRDVGLRLLEEAGIEVIEQDFWSSPALPVADATCDVVSMLDVVEHLPGHPLRQLRELHRATRRGGRCLLSGPNAVSIRKRIDLLLGRHPYIPFDQWTGDEYHLHVREYTAVEYRMLLERCGFDDVEVVRSQAVWRTRARNRYHRGVHARLSPTTVGLYAMLALETVLPPLRHTVYCIAERR